MTPGTRGLLTLGITALALGAIGTATGAGKGDRNVARFATLTFGEQGGRAALDASPSPAPQSPSPPMTFTDYRTPNGWLLRPAGTQLDTQRAPTGVTVSPDAQTVVAVSSGIFDEQITVVDASTFTKTNEFTSDLYMGAAINGSGTLWVSTGNRNRIFQYQLVGPTAQCVRCVKVFPGGPEAGLLPSIPVLAYPGNMALGSDGRLFVVGNLSVPGAPCPPEGPTPECYLDTQVPGPGPVCAGSDICSVVNVVDVTNPLAPSPAVRYIPVGRDAFGIVLNEGKGKLYVTNWADETNPSRSGGLGTVSVVDLTTETEVQVFRVGHHPTGIALSPDKSTLFVANSTDDSLSKLTLGSTGLIAAATTIDARTIPGVPRAATPLALGFTADGNYLLVGLAGQNAIEVRTAAGDAIPRAVPVELIRRRSPTVSGSACDTPANRTLGGSRRAAAPPSCRFRTLRIPHTYIPAGWYPSAIASAPHPDTTASTRIYVTDLKGIGAGAGENAQASVLMGSRTQGILQVIDIPTDGGEQAQAFNDWTAAVVENNNWGPLFRRTRRDAAVNPCKRAPLPPAGGFDLSPPPENTGTLSKFLCHQSRRRGPSPYHVLYIVKENKTFDSYFGDLPTRGLPDADGDQTFLLFGEDGGTKNQHNLARTFTLGDNFWADSEASTTGHRWTSAGYANEYMEITWNPEYSEGFRGNRGGGQYENGDFICSNPGGCFEECGCLHDDAVGGQEGEQGEPEERLVDLLSVPSTNPRGISFRIYSDDVNRDSLALTQRVPLDLWGFRPSFLQHGRDLDFPDTDRANLFIFGTTVSHAWSSDKNNGQQPESFGKEIGFCGAPDRLAEANYPDGGFCARTDASSDEYAKYSLAAWVAQYDTCRAGGGSDEACQAAMPNFIYMALPVNHTLGFNPGSPTPQSMVADNDYAVGLIMQELSKTAFWKNTLVLITEDDTQLTGDHVDAHRSYVMSSGGLSRQHGAEGRVSHQAGSFPSILKTIQVLFGVPSLTIYDRAAVPLHDFIVVNEADRLATPGYTAVDPGIPFASNPSEGALARLSQKVDWRIDRGDPALVTAIMYHGLRGWPLPEKYQALAKE